MKTRIEYQNPRTDPFTATVIAAGGWETGPAYPFLIIGGSIVGGTVGYMGGNAITHIQPPTDTTYLNTIQ